MAEDQTASIDSDMKTLLDATTIIRKSVTKCRKWRKWQSFLVFIDGLYKAQNMSFVIEKSWLDMCWVESNLTLQVKHTRVCIFDIRISIYELAYCSPIVVILLNISFDGCLLFTSLR